MFVVPVSTRCPGIGKRDTLVAMLMDLPMRMAVDDVLDIFNAFTLDESDQPSMDEVWEKGWGGDGFIDSHMNG